MAARRSNLRPTALPQQLPTSEVIVPLSPSEKGQAFFAAELVSCSKKHSLLCSGEHKNLTVPGQIRVSDRRQGRRLQPGLLNGAKFWFSVSCFGRLLLPCLLKASFSGARYRWPEFLPVPLGATLKPLNDTGVQSDTAVVYSSFICAVIPSGTWKQ